MNIYTQYLLASPWHLNHPRVTKYTGPTLAPAPRIPAQQSLGHTLMTTYNEDERHNAKPNDFGLTWSSSEHDKTKTETNLYNEYIFKIASYNIDKLKDWIPPLPIEKYKRIVLRIHPQGFFLIPGAVRPVNPLLPHRNLNLRQWPSQSPNADSIIEFLARFTSLYSLHICIEDKGHTPSGETFRRWFGSKAAIGINGIRKRVTPFKDAVEEMYANPSLSQIPGEKRWKYAIFSARKNIGDRVMPESLGRPVVPVWIPWPGENDPGTMVRSEVSVRSEPPAGQKETDAATAEKLLAADWEEKWLGREKEERTALKASGEKVCVECGWRAPPTPNPWYFHNCTMLRSR